MKKIIQEFKVFIMRGNVLDLAVGVIIGGAFQGIINSLVNDVMMPLITLCTGGINFTDWFIALDGNHYATLAAAKQAGTATLNYGTFLTAVVNFLIMAFVIFMMVKMMNVIAARGKKAESESEPQTKECPFCKSAIPVAATRCPHCTSTLSKESSVA